MALKPADLMLPDDEAVRRREAGEPYVIRMMVPDEEGACAVDDMLRAILANGPLAVSHCIEAVNHGLDMCLDDACLLEATLFGVGAASEQMHEGTAAFLEKRKPQWRR